MGYVFMTDSDSDLPYRLKVSCDIPVVYMPYSIDGKEYFDDLGQSIDHKTYYDKMRAGAAPVTSSLNEAAYEEVFEPIFADGQDILFIAFSSQMSSTIIAMRNTLARLQEKYPERKYRVVDTLSISAPQTILVLKAHRMYKAGKSMDEVADWVEENKLRAQAWVTVDDLDEESFKIFRREALRSKRMTKKELDIPNDELLSKLGLMKDGKLKRAAVLLFYRDPEIVRNGSRNREKGASGRFFDPKSGMNQNG